LFELPRTGASIPTIVNALSTMLNGIPKGRQNRSSSVGKSVQHRRNSRSRSVGIGVHHPSAYTLTPGFFVASVMFGSFRHVMTSAHKIQDKLALREISKR